MIVHIRVSAGLHQLLTLSSRALQEALSSGLLELVAKEDVKGELWLHLKVHPCMMLY
jgi:hypothetical protein